MILSFWTVGDKTGQWLTGPRKAGDDFDAALVASIEQIVSAPRLHRYRNAATSDREVAVLYCWNIQLSEALLPSVAILEVALRNAVHDAMTNHEGTEWWFKNVLNAASSENVLKIIGDLNEATGPPADGGQGHFRDHFRFLAEAFRT